MLVLSRRPRQVVLVGSDIQITVLDVEGGRVRLGITAPRELKVLRQELQDLLRSQPLPTPSPRSSPLESPPPA
jgi:carbon storage regulator